MKSKKFKVGQIWEDLNGNRCSIISTTNGYHKPIIAEYEDNSRHTFTKNGGYWNDEGQESNRDLIILVKDL